MLLDVREERRRFRGRNLLIKSLVLIPVNDSISVVIKRKEESWKLGRRKNTRREIQCEQIIQAIRLMNFHFFFMITCDVFIWKNFHRKKNLNEFSIFFKHRTQQEVLSQKGRKHFFSFETWHVHQKAPRNLRWKKS